MIKAAISVACVLLAVGYGSAQEGPLFKKLDAKLEQQLTQIGGQVEVHYPLTAVHEMRDFKAKGFDLLDFHQESALELGAGSRGTGSLVHKANLEGDFEIEFDMWVKHNTPSASVAILLSKKVAVHWGQCLVKLRGFKPYDRKGRRADPSLFKENRNVHVKIVRDGNRVTVTANKQLVSDYRFTKNELKKARFGLVAHNVRFVFTNLRIRFGVKDPEPEEPSEG